jgi:7-cyano-7-deazaguanine synthase
MSRGKKVQKNGGINEMKNVLILGSGGIDSTACIQFYKNLKFQIEVLFVDYGQASSKKEYSAIKLITEHFNVILNKVVIENLGKFEDGVIKGRNAFLFFTALMYYKKQNGIIASGIHYGTNYYDCSVDFLNEIQSIFEKYNSGIIKIDAPFLTFNKYQIYEYCLNEKVPLNLTYSCELGLEQPCGKCLTCKDLIEICKQELIK